mmetsp:Transcript_18049/g.46822  ORF Transcript_18049/g.46822 Transcript_18049/m.46822 type:complete len:276 (-) Transcript_18049:32-859(-)
MKYDKGFQKEEKKKSVLEKFHIRKLPSHAPVQVCLTTVGVGLAVGSFLCAAVLNGNAVQLAANYDGDLKNNLFPCARKPLPVCLSLSLDTCNSKCCPTGYLCVRDPTVGIYCQDALVTCGAFDFCLDVSDAAGTCERDACQERHSVTNMTHLVYVMSAAGVALDLIDLILCFALADNVVFKSIGNLISCGVKLLAFAALVGVGTDRYLSQMAFGQCFNADGAIAVERSQLMFTLGALALFFSASSSFCLVPISAMHGGRLSDRPHYQLKIMDIGG